MLTFQPEVFLVQIVAFVALWIGLKRLLFDPMVRLLEQREARTVGAREEAQRVSAAAETAGAEYEQRLHEVRQALLAEAQAAHAANLAEEQRLLNQARSEEGSRLAQLRENLALQVEAARPSLTAEARELGGRMVERVAGRALG